MLLKECREIWVLILSFLDMLLDLSMFKSDSLKFFFLMILKVKIEIEEEQIKELDFLIKVKEERLSLKLLFLMLFFFRQMVIFKFFLSFLNSQRSDEYFMLELFCLMVFFILFLIIVLQLFYMGKLVFVLFYFVSKCMDCNIVFYKCENYLIYKKYYCFSC